MDDAERRAIRKQLGGKVDTTSERALIAEDGTVVGWAFELEDGQQYLVLEATGRRTKEEIERAAELARLFDPHRLGERLIAELGFRTREDADEEVAS
ncbi:hypothetical protein BH09ACT13_BH09ACT13_04990 [soil metagenome]